MAGEYIYIRANWKYYRVELSDILYIKSLENYVELFLNNKSLITKCTITWFENQLPSDSFMRVHRSYIINTQKVDEIEQNSIAIEQYTIPISRLRRTIVISKLISG